MKIYLENRPADIAAISTMLETHGAASFNFCPNEFTMLGVTLSTFIPQLTEQHMGLNCGATTKWMIHVSVSRIGSFYFENDPKEPLNHDYVAEKLNLSLADAVGVTGMLNSVVTDLKPSSPMLSQRKG